MQVFVGSVACQDSEHQEQCIESLMNFVRQALLWRLGDLYLAGGMWNSSLFSPITPSLAAHELPCLEIWK